MSGYRKSPSSLTQFLFCERQFYYEKVLGLARPESEAIKIGHRYHAALAEAAAGRLPDDAPEQVRWIAANLLPHLDVEAIETWSRKEFTAKIDLVSRTTPIVKYGRVVGSEPGRCVVDWKIVTGRRRRSQADADDSLQLALYCLEVGAHHGAFIEVPHPDGMVRTILSEFDPFSLTRWRRYFRAQFASLSSRDPKSAVSYRLASTGHPLCSPTWCAYWRRCPGGEGVE